jgi:hypothetical protein
VRVDLTSLTISLDPLRTERPGKGDAEREGLACPIQVEDGVESKGDRGIVNAKRAPADPKDGKGM